MVRRLGLVSAWALLACGSDDPTTLRFEVSDPTATVVHEFDNGDVLLTFEGGHRRVRLNFTSAPDELPGVQCNWLRPASDGTEYVQCANTYSRAPGGAWQRLAMPEGSSRFVGQAKDGTRYFTDAGTNAVVAQLPGAGTFVPVTGFTTLEVSPYGDFLAVGPDAVRLLRGGVAGPAIPLPVYPFGPPSGVNGVAPLVDAGGFIYIRTETGTVDRYALESGARDAGWFAPPAGSNPSYRFMGVSSEGSLFAISEPNEGLSSGQPDNLIATGDLMVRHHGDDEWQGAGALFGLNYLFFEQPPIAWPGRDGAWWLSTCIANCAGIAGRSQKEIVRWQPSGTADVPAVPTAYEAFVDVGFGIAMGAQGQPALAFGDPDCETVPGTDVFAVVYAVCHTPGRHAATVTTTDPTGTVVKRLEVSIDVAGPPAQPVRPPRHRTLFEHASTIEALTYVGVDGLLHRYSSGATPADVALVSPTGVVAVSPQHRVLLTGDGAVYSFADPNMFAATRVTVPPAAAISGTFMVGTDGQIYPVVDGAAPLAGISGAVSLDCETLYPAGMARESCTALDATGRTWTFDKVGPSVIDLTEHPADPMLAAVIREGGLSRTGQWYRQVEGTTWLEPSVLVDLTGATRTANASGTGDFYVPTALMVTRGGEAWIRAFEGRNNFGVKLPLGRTAVAIEPALRGAFVWLDDGRVGHVELMSVQGGDADLDWEPLPVMAKRPGS